MEIARSWNVSPKEAVEIQKKLREQVTLTPLVRQPETIGGCDMSLERFASDGFAGFVTLSFPEMQLIDESVVHRPISFPYIPGLLSFREIPMLLDAWKALKQKPDVLVVDGVGIAHPRRMGIATHLGLVLGIPTIGCAKSVLTGVYEEPPDERGAISYLRDRKTGEIIGAALRTRPRVKPVYVSPGHLITLEDSLEIMRRSMGKYRIPEPTRLAHETVNKYRRIPLRGISFPQGQRE